MTIIFQFTRVRLKINLLIYNMSKIIKKKKKFYTNSYNYLLTFSNIKTLLKLYALQVFRGVRWVKDVYITSIQWVPQKWKSSLLHQRLESVVKIWWNKSVYTRLKKWERRQYDTRNLRGSAICLRPRKATK